LSEQGHRRHRHEIRSCLGENLLYINRTSGELLGIADGDWVKVTSVHSTMVALIGVLTERWLFFAEAKHAVTLHYGHNLDPP
jgi:anaerobic selenocysteine-containing dehydrogenase